jgi:hypothetical protein
VAGRGRGASGHVCGHLAGQRRMSDPDSRTPMSVPARLRPTEDHDQAGATAELEVRAVLLRLGVGMAHQHKGQASPPQEFAVVP